MKKLKIIQTSDVHSYMFAHNYIEDKSLGLLKVASYIKVLRERYFVLLIDTGDMFQGSALTHYLNKSLHKKEFLCNPITDLLNQMKYDVLTLGNHEFNYGLDYLKWSLNDFNGQILNANIIGMNDIISTKPYHIFTYNNIKVADRINNKIYTKLGKTK